MTSKIKTKYCKPLQFRFKINVVEKYIMEIKK